MAQLVRPPKFTPPATDSFAAATWSRPAPAVGSEFSFTFPDDTTTAAGLVQRGDLLEQVDPRRFNWNAEGRFQFLLSARVTVRVFHFLGSTGPPDFKTIYTPWRLYLTDALGVLDPFPGAPGHADRKAQRGGDNTNNQRLQGGALGSDLMLLLDGVVESPGVGQPLQWQFHLNIDEMDPVYRDTASGTTAINNLHLLLIPAHQ